MSSQASELYELYELCKKVYELTKWECDGEYVYHHNDLVDIVRGKPAGDYWENNWWFPLYTSDYLLEKLPATIKNEFDGDDDYLILYRKSGTWYADYMGQFLQCKDDTPLKALLRLTLKLHEEGLI